MPMDGLLFSTNAILIVNSSFFLINPFVPSIGSTNQYLLHFFRISNLSLLISSEIIGRFEVFYQSKWTKY